MVVQTAGSIPLTIGGWGPREGAAAWAFAAAGLGAATGITVATLYAVLMLVAVRPGAALLLGDVVRRGAARATRTSRRRADLVPQTSTEAGMTIRTESSMTIAGGVPERVGVCLRRRAVAGVGAHGARVLGCAEAAPLQPGAWVEQRAKGPGAHPPPERRRSPRSRRPAPWPSPGRWAPPRRAGGWSSSRWTTSGPTP